MIKKGSDLFGSDFFSRQFELVTSGPSLTVGLPIPGQSLQVLDIHVPVKSGLHPSSRLTAQLAEQVLQADPLDTVSDVLQSHQD